MEKQLMDKIRNHTTDDIDKDMITARLKSAHGKLDDILKELGAVMDKLHDLCGEKRDELGLLEFSFVLACDDIIIHNDDDSHHKGIPILCTFGNKDSIKNLIQALSNAIDS